MVTVVPTNQTINPPSLTALFDAMRRDFEKSINCAKIGVIQSFSPGDASHGPTATVKIAQQQVTSIASDSTRTLAEYPLLLLVPVWFPNGGGFTLTFPVAAGDECILLFNDRELDNWLTLGAGTTGQSPQAPTTGRLHDLADAIALVGLRSNPRGLENISTTATQLRSEDGGTFVEVNAQGVKVHAGTVYEWDVQGYGQKITWTGGANYHIDNYVTGAVVTSTDHPISPPGPP